jgi:hypothetical protein
MGVTLVSQDSRPPHESKPVQKIKHFVDAMDGKIWLIMTMVVVELEMLEYNINLVAV